MKMLASASASVASLSAARPTSAMEVFPESKPMPASSPKLERPSVTAKTEAQKDTEKSESIATKKEASEKLSVLGKLTESAWDIVLTRSRSHSRHDCDSDCRFRSNGPWTAQV